MTPRSAIHVPAVASAARRIAVTDAAGEQPLSCFGEVGLTRELRTVTHGGRRLAEAAKSRLDPVLDLAGHKRRGRRSRGR
jgi:predicted ATP-dependent serine protease